MLSALVPLPFHVTALVLHSCLLPCLPCVISPNSVKMVYRLEGNMVIPPQKSLPSAFVYYTVHSGLSRGCPDPARRPYHLYLVDSYSLPGRNKPSTHSTGRPTSLSYYVYLKVGGIYGQSMGLDSIESLRFSHGGDFARSRGEVLDGVRVAHGVGADRLLHWDAHEQLLHGHFELLAAQGTGHFGDRYNLVGDVMRRDVGAQSFANPRFELVRQLHTGTQHNKKRHIILPVWQLNSHD